MTNTNIELSRCLLTKSFMPHLVKNNRLHAPLEHCQCPAEVLRPGTSLHHFDPARPVKRPVQMKEWHRYVRLQLENAHTKCADDEAGTAKCGTIPTKLTRWRKTKLVREVTFLLSLLIVLVLVEGQGVRPVEVLVMFEHTLGTCTIKKDMLKILSPPTATTT